MADTVLVHPNQDKASSKATKAGTVLLLVVSAALIAIVTVGGWASLQGAQIIAVAYFLVYCVMAYYVARWNRGILPVAAALAILLMVVATIAAPGWFERDHNGFDNPGIPPSLLGLFTALVVPVQFLLIVFAMRGFSQQWNVEVEVSRDDYDRGYRGGDVDEAGEYTTAPQS
ncbi:MAG: hypothetical protein QOK25_1337 [Thermoleophilaceae bacterium]|jgi:lysylphosphatidylglycerol synthetase-like protein (DUF2156 family)|nr:hypothetical protein [Thermoleophilaceae bacterium]